MNSFGRHLRFEIFGESHGRGAGAVLDGLPPGLPVDMARLQTALDRRRPGRSALVSPRREPDRLQILSGVHHDVTTGAPLALWIENQDVKSGDYDAIARTPRPGHADLPAWARSQGHADLRGGGHFSGRLTAPLVAAGALCAELLGGAGIAVGAHLQAAGGLQGPRGALDIAAIEAAVWDSAVYTACTEQEPAFIAAVQAAQSDRDSLGGVVEFRAEGLPMGLGEPWVDGVEAHLAHLLFSIPAVKAVSFGAGFEAARMRGSAHNDPWMVSDDDPTAITTDDARRVAPATNFAGGILGGLTTGAPLWGHVAIKPTSSIFRPQSSVDLPTGRAATLELKGRHDPCIAIRAVPVVQAAVQLALADLWLRGGSARFQNR